MANSIFKLFLTLVVILIIGGILFQTNREIFNSWSDFRFTNPKWLLIGMSSFFFAMTCKTSRFLILFSGILPIPEEIKNRETQGETAPFQRKSLPIKGQLFSAFLLSYTLSYFLQGSGLVLKSAYAKLRFKVEVSKTLSLVLIEKVFSLVFVLLIFLLLGNQLLPSELKEKMQLGKWSFAAPLQLFLLFMLVAGFLLKNPLLHLLIKWAKKLPERLEKKTTPSLVGIQQAVQYTSKPSTLSSAMTLTALGWFFEVGFLYSIFWLSGLEISLLQSIMGFFIIFAMGSLLQVGGGLGSYELGYILFASTLSLEGPILAIALQAHGLLLLSNLILALLGLFGAKIKLGDLKKWLQKENRKEKKKSATINQAEH